MGIRVKVELPHSSVADPGSGEERKKSAAEENQAWKKDLMDRLRLGLKLGKNY